MYGYRCCSGPLTVEGEEKRLSEAKAGVCPSCKGKLRDLRGSGFSTHAIEREGVCYWWCDDAYTCVARPRP